MESGDIGIYGRLRSGTSEGVLAITDEIKDVHYDKTQAQINGEVGTLAIRIGDLESEFEDGGIISAIKTEIIAQAGLIETKVSQTDFDENNNIINEYFSDIRQTADQIQLTVTENKHELDGRLIEQQSQITQQADLIESKVSRDDYDADGALIQEQFSAIEQMATQIEATVTENKRISDEQYQETSGQLLIQSGLIETKVSQTDYDADNVVREQRYSQIEQTAEQIQSTVAHNKNEADGSFQNVQSLITQQADLISTKVSQVEYDANNLQFSERFSSIEQTADHITSTVEEYRLQANESISALQTQILQQSDQILLKAEKAELDSVQSVLSNSIGELSVRADGISASVTGIQQELDSHDETLGAYYQWLTSLQTQVDGEIDTWFKPYSPLRNVAPEGQEPQWELDPTVSPYFDWLVEERERGAEVVRDAHVRDVFYNTSTGYGYIFTGTGEKGHRVYGWSLITDSAVVEALAAAARAQTTADGKMRTFLQQPVPPYQPGDMWIKPHTVTIDGSEVTYNEVWNCITEKTEGQAFSISDWAKSNNYDAEITKANLKVLADAIVGQVTTYDSNGLITNKSTIEQKAGQIRLSVANTAIGTALATNGSINSALLDTGIDITQGKIVVTANNFMVQDQQGRVALMTSGNKIKASYLEIDGIFSTTPGSVWMTNVNNLNQTALGYANTAEGNAKSYADTGDTNTLDSAKSYADTVAGTAYDDALDYMTDNIVPSVTQAYTDAINALGVPDIADRIGAAEEDVDGLEGDVSDLSGDLDAAILRIQATEGGLSDLGYLSAALLNGQTVAAGGLILSSLIQLGSTTGHDSSWQVWSGINGVYNSSVSGNGIAAWYGGAMLDRYYSGNTDANRAAKTLFRMDGSGYLASNKLWWGANGELHIDNNTIIDNSGNLTLSQLASVVTELASYFTVVDYVKDGTTRHYLKLNASGAGGLDGFASDGFIVAGGAGSSSGGGGGGVDLLSVWSSLQNNNEDTSYNTWKIHTAHLPSLNATGGLSASYSTPSGSGSSMATQLNIDITDIAWSKITSGKPTTLAGYGITDANISSGLITLGSNTIRPIVSASEGTATGDGAVSYSNGALTIQFPTAKGISGNDWLCYVDPEEGEEITIDDPGTTGTVLWGAESANVVALDVNGVSKILVKQAALDGINSAISTLSALIGTKQDYISDLSSIRSNASLGATAHSWGDHRQAGYLTSVPTASASTLGLIRIGTGLSIDGSGVVSVTGQTVGTVTSVGLSMPTGFSVGSSPITSSGTIAVTFASGYSLPSNATQATWTAKYDKPSTGIPKTDLESAVQTSLEKADTALQSHQTVTLASGTNNGTLKITTAAGTTDNVAVTGLGTAAYRGVASTIGSSITNLVPGSLLYNVLGGAFDSSNTVVGFVNSSIATATATFLGTNDVATTESEFITWANGLTHDLNDYVFWGTTDSVGNFVYKRYKYNGSSWIFEYDLNNSSFTAAQWSAINSGITSTLVAAFNAKYDKPSGGIPKTDLASDVQTSLGKADSALQSHQNIYALTINNSAGTAVLSYNPKTAAGSLTLTKAMVGLGNVENFVYNVPTGAEQTYTYPV